MAEQDAFSILQQMTSGYILSRCLHIVAEIGIADVLDNSPRTAAELANLAGVNADALNRVLALLSAHGVFETRGDRFEHTPASRMLQTNHPQSMRAFVRNIGAPLKWMAYLDLDYSVRTGQAAVEKSFPNWQWNYYAEHVEEGAIFNAAMADKARGQIPAIVKAYDFSGFSVIGDIGGGLGHLLFAVMDSAPNAKGILFDLPHVIQAVADVHSDRITLKSGDFFRDRLPVCDAYLLMEIIHDWGDDQALAILKALREVAPSQAKLLLIETVVLETPGPHWSKTLNVHMLAMLGGRQRTLKEYESLLQNAGFSFQREVDTGAGISIIEAVCL